MKTIYTRNHRKVYEVAPIRIVAMVTAQPFGARRAEDVTVDISCTAEIVGKDALGEDSWQALGTDALPAYWGLHINSEKHWSAVKNMGIEIESLCEDVRAQEYWRQERERKESEAT